MRKTMPAVAAVSRLRVEEVGVVGAILVSGLGHVSDHDFIVKCVSRYLHIDEVPRIRGDILS